MRYSASLKAKEQGAIVRIPEHIYVPTLPEYRWAISYYHDDKSKAYINLDMYANDLALLRLFYSIWWIEYKYRKQMCHQIKVYIPGFGSVFDNHRAPTPAQVDSIVDYLKQFEEIKGVITWLQPTEIEGNTIYNPVTEEVPVIERVEYDPITKIITIDSRYFELLTHEIYRNSMKRDKKGKVVTNQFGDAQFIKSHHTAIKSGIIMERSPIAVELVFLITGVMVLAGRPRVSVEALLERNPLLLNHFKANHYNSTALRKAIQKAFDIMTCKRGNFNVVRTELHELYPNLMLPKLDDLTASNLTEYTLEFPKNSK